MNDGKSIFEFKTLELPWLNNWPRISCIPVGTYSIIKLAPTDNIPYEHLGLLLVPKRSGICVHAGNFNTQILGCILVGIDYKDINEDGQLDVINSRETLDKLIKLMPEKAEIEISLEKPIA